MTRRRTEEEQRGNQAWVCEEEPRGGPEEPEGKNREKKQRGDQSDDGGITEGKPGVGLYGRTRRMTR